jgi:hypothetical protein
VAIRRNYTSIALLPLLPPDLRETVLAEFRNLVAGGYIANAAQILAGPGWGQKDVLLASLESLPDLTKQSLLSAVAALDREIQIPGLAPRGQRPWK